MAAEQAILNPTLFTGDPWLRIDIVAPSDRISYPYRELSLFNTHASVNAHLSFNEGVTFVSVLPLGQYFISDIIKGPIWVRADPSAATAAFLRLEISASVQRPET